MCPVYHRFKKHTLWYIFFVFLDGIEQSARLILCSYDLRVATLKPKIKIFFERLKLVVGIS